MRKTRQANKYDENRKYENPGRTVVSGKKRGTIEKWNLCSSEMTEDTLMLNVLKTMGSKYFFVF